MNICMIHNQQYIDYCRYCGPGRPITTNVTGTRGFGPLHEVELPKYPGSIEGDPTELDRLREENARLKAAVDGAREAFDLVRDYPHSRPDDSDNVCHSTCFRCAMNDWISANL